MKPDRRWTLEDPIIVLHRYYLQAALMHRFFNEMIVRYPEGRREWPSEGFLNIITLMNLWYGALYAVAEAWRDLKLSDPKVDPLIADPRMDKLKRYRNAVFHYQREYFSPKMMEALQYPDFAPWVQVLHDALGRYLLEYLDKRPKPSAP